MKVSVLLRTSEYRGDHGADVATAHDIRPDETVEQLVSRLLTKSVGFGRDEHREAIAADWIELRAVVNPEPLS